MLAKDSNAGNDGGFMSDQKLPTGRAAGGKARMQMMSPDERSRQAKKAAAARWSKKDILRATHSSQDHPLKIAGVDIDCYVLEDRTRVISQRSMIRAIGLTRGGARYDAEQDRIGAEIPRFATQMWLKPFISNDLESALSNPIFLWNDDDFQRYWQAIGPAPCRGHHNCDERHRRNHHGSWIVDVHRQRSSGKG
jgi:hypothetical protein